MLNDIILVACLAAFLTVFVRSKKPLRDKLEEISFLGFAFALAGVLGIARAFGVSTHTENIAVLIGWIVVSLLGMAFAAIADRFAKQDGARGWGGKPTLFTYLGLILVMPLFVWTPVLNLILGKKERVNG